MRGLFTYTETEIFKSIDMSFFFGTRYEFTLTLQNKIILNYIRFWSWVFLGGIIII